MIKMLVNYLICVTLLYGGNMEVGTIQQYMCECSKAQIIVDNNFYPVEDLNELNVVLKEMLNNSKTMPAFGVSLDNETKIATKTGVWLKLKYDKTEVIDDLPFDTLLVNVVPEYNGFNIIRGNNGNYSGRCFYIDLKETMKSLYDYIVKLSKY